MKKIIIIAIAITMIFWSGLKVKADTITSWTTQQARVQTTHDGTDSWTSWTNINGDNATIFSNLSNPVKAIAWRVKTNNGMSNLNVYSFRFSYKPTPDAIHPSSYYMQNDTTGNEEEITCTITRNETSGYYWYDCSFQPQTSYTSSDYLYIKINFTLSYLTEMRMSIRGYDERKGTNAVITEQTNNIITNNEQNTQEIINSLTEANENLLNGLTEKNQVCQYYDKTNIVLDNKYMNTSGGISDSNGFGVTDYINIKEGTINVTQNAYISYCWYDMNKTFISCTVSNATGILTQPNNAFYLRTTINKSSNKPQFTVCKNGNQAIMDTDHTYTENNINGTVDEYEQVEGQIEDITDISLTDRLNILWETGPMTWIWQTFDTIRGSYQKVFGLMTSFLALGIIRLVLGR